MAMVLAACNDGYDPEGAFQPSLTARYLHADESSFASGTANAFTHTFNVESCNTPWVFGDVPSWIALTPASGSASASVSLSAEENLSADEARTAVFYLKANDASWNYSQAMSVSQARATAVITLDQTEINAPGGGGTFPVAVTSNCEWSVIYACDWLTVTPDTDGGAVTLSVAPNPSNSYRSTTVYVSGENTQASVEIKQSPSGVTASEGGVTFEKDASKYELTVTSDIAWIAETSDTWISVTPSEGAAGTTLVSVEAAPNESVNKRYGYVTFKSGDFTKLQIEVQQGGLTLSADASMSFGSTPSTQSLSISSNTFWAVLNAPGWVSVTPASGSGDAKINVTVADNPSVSSRTGTITLGQAGVNLKYDVKITQAGKYFDLSTTLLEFSDKGGILTVDIKSDASWTSEVSDDWFTSTPLSGTGNVRVSVSATENTSIYERTGLIRYDFAEESSTVNIHQQAKYLTIDNSTFEFTSKGGRHVIDFSTNDSWTAAVEHNVDWITLSQTSGDGSGSITITAKDNPSVNVRSTAVVITPKYAQAVRILITQLPRKLEVNARSVVFFAKGGTSAPVEVVTDGTFSVTGDADWFTVNTQGSSFTVTATPNGSKESRRGSVTVALTDLSEGSLSVTLPVIQGGEGCSFVVNPYPDTDENWSPMNAGNLTVTVTGFSTDKDWDAKFSSAFSVSVTGYSTDKDWNRQDNTSCHATVTLYGAEKDWNPSTGSSGTFTAGSYSSDSTWGVAPGSSASISTTPFGQDSDWNN